MKAFSCDYDGDFGEIGGITFTKGFLKESLLMQCDLLKDAINELSYVYNQRLAEWEEELRYAQAAGIAHPEA